MKGKKESDCCLLPRDPSPQEESGRGGYGCKLIILVHFHPRNPSRSVKEPTVHSEKEKACSKLLFTGS